MPTVSLFLFLFAALLGARVPLPPPTPTPGWSKEPTAYRTIPFGLPYADMEGRVLLTGCHPGTREHESGTRTCEGSGFRSNGAAVEDVFVFQDDLFVGVSLSFDSDDYEKLREVFLVKYGEPTRLETTRVMTRNGTRYDNESLNWEGHSVSVSLERFGDAADKGLGTIFLNTYLEQREKERQERLRKDADVF